MSQVPLYRPVSAGRRGLEKEKYGPALGIPAIREIIEFVPPGVGRLKVLARNTEAILSLHVTTILSLHHYTT